MSDLLITEQPQRVIVRLWHGETWYDQFPLEIAPGVPLDLTSVNDYDFEWFARPAADTTAYFMRLAVNSGIIVESEVNGALAFVVGKTFVETIPTSPNSGWFQFLRMNWTDAIYGPVQKLIWRGPLFVHPALDTSP